MWCTSSAAGSMAQTGLGGSVTELRISARVGLSPCSWLVEVGTCWSVGAVCCSCSRSEGGVAPAFTAAAVRALVVGPDLEAAAELGLVVGSEDSAPSIRVSK